MKKTILCLLIAAMWLSLCGFGSVENTLSTRSETFSGGEGTAEQPYQISSAEDMRRLAKLVNVAWDLDNPYRTAYYALTKDIDLGGAMNPWTPLGDFTNGASGTTGAFKGFFDGRGHTISGIYINQNTDGLLAGKQKCFGLFGLAENGWIKNLTISDSTIKVRGSRSEYVGAIAGEVHNTLIENCTVADSVYLSNSYDVGGVVGNASDPVRDETDCAIRGCVNAARIECTGTVGIIGGIVAYASVSIENCVNNSDLSGKELAGIVCRSSSDIIDCVNNGSIHGQRYGAGIVNSFSNGALNASMVKAVRIRGCSNTGDVSVEDGNAGGIAGKISSGTVENCENSGTIRGSLCVGGIFGECVFEPFVGPAEDNALIRNCVNSGAILGLTDSRSLSIGGIGGSISGSSTNVTIEGCTNTGVLGTETNTAGEVGGILGSVKSGIYTADGEMYYFLQDCDNSGEIHGGAYGVGGILGYADTSEKTAKLLLTVERCFNRGALHFDSLLSRAGGIIGEVVCINSYTDIKDCVNSGDLIPYEKPLDSGDSWYPWSCVMGGIVGHFGESIMDYNPADAEPVTGGEPVASISGCSSSGSFVTYEDTGVTYYTDEFCGFSDFLITVER